MADIGFIVESGNEVQDRIEKKLGSIGLPIGRVLGLLEAAIRDQLRKSPGDAQVITCIGQFDQILPGTAVKRDTRLATMQLANGASALGDAVGQEADKNSLSDLLMSQVSDQEASSRIAATLVSISPLTCSTLPCLTSAEPRPYRITEWTRWLQSS